MKDIAKNIKQLRVRKNMTQDELAEKLFVTRQTVSNYETGKSRPDVDMLTRIADVLGTDVNALIYGIPTPPDRKRQMTLTGICCIVTLVLWILFVWLDKIFYVYKGIHYDVRPTMLLLTVYRPVFYLILGWTLMQLLGCFTNLHPFQHPKTRIARICIWGLLCFFFLVESPWIVNCFVDVSIPLWWQHFALFFMGGSAKLPWLDLSPLPLLLGAALWLCGFPRSAKP